MCDGVPFLRMTNRGLRWNDWCEALERSPWVRTTNHWASETLPPTFQQSNNKFLCCWIVGTTGS